MWADFDSSDHDSDAIPWHSLWSPACGRPWADIFERPFSRPNDLPIGDKEQFTDAHVDCFLNRILVDVATDTHWVFNPVESLTLLMHGFTSEVTIPNFDDRIVRHMTFLMVTDSNAGCSAKFLRRLAGCDARLAFDLCSLSNLSFECSNVDLDLT